MMFESFWTCSSSYIDLGAELVPECGVPDSINLYLHSFFLKIPSHQQSTKKLLEINSKASMNNLNFHRQGHRQEG